MKITRVTLMALALLLLVAAPAFADGGGAESITISVSCETDPETVEITNGLDTPLLVNFITSLNDPREDEPFNVAETVGREVSVAVGETVTFSAGSGTANPDVFVLTDQLIFDNDADDEGVRVDVGPEGVTGVDEPLSFTVDCDQGSRTFTFGDEPDMPGTGAGGMAGGGLPAGNIAAALSVLAAGAYTARRRLR